MKRDPLFTIERNKNKNVVQYDACLLPDDNISDSTPVDAYWVMADGHKENLNFLEENYAYGIDLKEKLGENKFQIFLAALRDRGLVVEKIDGEYKAVVRINGEPSILEKVYIDSKEHMIGLPEVKYIDLMGWSLQTNRSIQERIKRG